LIVTTKPRRREEQNNADTLRLQLSRCGRPGRLRSLRSALRRPAFSRRLATSPVLMVRNTVSVFSLIVHLKPFALFDVWLMLSGIMASSPVAEGDRHFRRKQFRAFHSAEIISYGSDYIMSMSE
jgi:hypothetical protein